MAQIAPENVLGIFHGRNESEVLVDPPGLFELKEVSPDELT
jgi:hypothetical protein